MARKLQDQPAALDHALYEIEMLIFCAHKLRSFGPGWDGSALLESFAVHARNLDEFFGNEKEVNGYMKPGHFVPSWDYGYRSDVALIRRASAQVSHLTYDRQTPQEKTAWDCPSITQRLLIPARQFLECVARDQALMAYQNNRERTLALLKLIPESVFSATTANIAAPQVLTIRMGDTVA